MKIVVPISKAKIGKKTCSSYKHNMPNKIARSKYGTPPLCRIFGPFFHSLQSIHIMREQHAKHTVAKVK